jgi:hypothetical protein
MFVSLLHAPCEAQADFGEALVVNAGLEQKAHSIPGIICVTPTKVNCPFGELILWQK